MSNQRSGASYFRRSLMSPFVYEVRSTALLFVDPYNDFLSEGGKVWPFVKDVAEEVGLLHGAHPRPCELVLRDSDDTANSAQCRVSLP